MNVFILTLVVVSVAMAGLGIGIILGRRGLLNACGGNALVRLCGACKLEELER